MVDETRKEKAPRKMRIKGQPRSIKTDGIPAADLNKLVAENVYNIRRSLNLTQEQMAKRTGMTAPSLGSLERAEKNITLASVAQVAAAYGVDPHALICGPNYGTAEDGGGLTLDVLARLTSSIDRRVQDLLVRYGPVSIGQAHLASIVGALFDALGNTDLFQPRSAKPSNSARHSNGAQASNEDQKG